jgi:hypothetical protein
MPLPDDILQRVARDFAAQNVAAAVDSLDAFRGPERPRVLRCVVHLAEGSPERLQHFLRVAELDYRDVILFAEYDRQDRHVRDLRREFE